MVDCYAVAVLDVLCYPAVTVTIYEIGLYTHDAYSLGSRSRCEFLETFVVVWLLLSIVAAETVSSPLITFAEYPC